MNILRWNTERRYIRSDNCEMWLTFYPQDPPGTLGEGFGTISIFNEMKMASNERSAFKLESESELITYVHKGALALEGPMGHSGVITAGEFQCMTIGRIFNQRVTNVSKTDLVHFFRIYLRLQSSQLGNSCVETQTRFSVAQRRNILCKVASPNAQKESLRINTHVHIYSSILDPGQHVVHPLVQGRKAWLHVVYGRVQANDVELSGGDGIGISDELSISLTVKENTELLLVDTTSDQETSIFNIAEMKLANRVGAMTR